MKALITGIEGFVGRYLAEYLLNNDISVVGTYLVSDGLRNINKNVKLYKLDITDEKEVNNVFKKEKPDWIFHLAAQSSAGVSWKKPKLTMYININGAINILDTLRDVGYHTRILLIGSSEEYGYIKPEDIPVNEKQNLKPGNPYAVSRIAQKYIGEVYQRAYDLDIIFVRAFNHIGPGQSPTFVVSDFAKRIAEIEKGLIEPVLKVGNLEVVRDFTDVRDIVKAYYALAEKGVKGELYNVGSRKNYKIQYILDTLLDMTEENISIENDPERMRPSDVPVVQCDNTKLKKVTGWSINYKIEDTLKDVLDYWRNNVSKREKNAERY